MRGVGRPRGELGGQKGAGRVKSQRTDKQKGLKSIWMIGFKPFLCQMKLVID